MRAPIQMVTGELPWPSESEDAFRAAVIAGSKGMSTDLLERAGMDEVLHQTIVNLLHPNPLHRCASHPHPQRHPPLCVPPSPTPSPTASPTAVRPTVTHSRCTPRRDHFHRIGSL